MNQKIADELQDLLFIIGFVMLFRGMVTQPSLAFAFTGFFIMFAVSLMRALTGSE